MNKTQTAFCLRSILSFPLYYLQALYFRPKPNIMCPWRLALSTIQVQHTAPMNQWTRGSAVRLAITRAICRTFLGFKCQTKHSLDMLGMTHRMIKSWLHSEDPTGLKTGWLTSTWIRTLMIGISRARCTAGFMRHTKCCKMI